MTGATELELLMFQIDANIKRLEKKMDQANGKVDKAARAMQKRMDQAAKDLDRSFGSAFGSMEVKAGVAFAAISAYALKSASDANELESAFQVAFGNASQDAETFAGKLADRVGRAAIDVKSQMTDLQLVLSGMGLEAEQSLEVVKRLAERSIDIGSLFNVSDEDAMRAVISGITGETEPLKKFGAVINDTAVKAELLRLGFKGNAEDASEAAKAIARTNLILQKTSVASGDAERTMDSLANMTKTAQAEFKKAAIALGKELYPAATEATKGATDLIKKFTELPSGVQLASLALLGLVASSGPIAQTIKGLQALIVLSGQARVALAALATQGGAAGAVAGAAGPVGFGVAAVGGITVAEMSVAEKKKAYEKVLKSPTKASDAELVAAQERAKNQLSYFSTGRAAQRSSYDRAREKLGADLSVIQAEIKRRDAVSKQAAQAEAQKAQTQADQQAQAAIAALGLSDSQKTGVGGNAKDDKKAAADARRAAEEALRNSRRVEDMTLRADMDLLQVKEAYAQTAAERRDLALQVLEMDQQGYARDLARAVADKEMTQAEADQLLFARKAVDEEQRRGIVRQSELDIAEERLRSEQAVADLTASYLSIASSLAKTQKEREAIARQMLSAEQAAQRQQLEARIASGEISAADAPRARSELDRLQGAQNKALDKDFEGPLKRYMETVIDLNAVAEQAAVDGLQDLSKGIVDAAMNAADLGDVVSNVFRKMISDFLTAQTEALIKQGADGVMGWLGGLFGGKRAGGGTVQAGKVYQVNDGGGQKEFFAAQMDGRVMTAAQINAASSRSLTRTMASPPQNVNVIVTVDGEGRIQAYVAEQSQQAAVAGAVNGSRLAQTEIRNRQSRTLR